MGQIGGRNDFKLSSQAFKIAVKMAEYIRSKKRGYFASVRENFQTRWKGNSYLGFLTCEEI